MLRSGKFSAVVRRGHDIALQWLTFPNSLDNGLKRHLSCITRKEHSGIFAFKNQNTAALVGILLLLNIEIFNEVRVKNS